MAYLDANDAPHIRILEGIHGPVFHSDELTFGYFTLEKGAVLKEHQHIHEQWTHVLEGELEFTLAGETRMLTSGMIAHMPSGTPHSAIARKKCLVIDCFRPIREDFRSLPLW